MEIKHGRVHDVCPDCGAEVIVAPMAAFMNQLAQSGFAGMAPVMVHKLPLCDVASDRADRAWKEISTRAEDEAEEKKAAEREKATTEREARQQQQKRREQATTKTQQHK